MPGWHPDPDDPSLLRHWNGKRWGSERRPRPSWAAQPRSAGLVSAAGPQPGGPQGAGPPPPSTGSRRKWYLLAGGALLLAFLVVSVPAWLGSDLDIPPQTVRDPGYTGRADAACADALPKLRQERPQSRDDNGAPQDFAARIDKAADSLEVVAADLRGIPTATAADATEIDRWLDDWDAYIALGRRYADSIADEDPELGLELSDRSRTLEKRIFGFAKGNDMPSCTF